MTHRVPSASLLLVAALLAPALLPAVHAVGDGLPNLVVSSVFLSQEAPRAGGSTSFCLTVANQGNATAGGFSVDVLLDGMLRERRVMIGGPNGAPELAAGNATFACVPSGTLARGSHELRLVADPDDAVAEGHEGDNQHLQTFFVPGPVDTDVAMVELTLFGEPVVGESMLLLGLVANRGAAPEDFGVGVRVDGALFIVTSVRLFPGVQTTVFLFAPGLPPGAHELALEADPLNQLAERDEGNNRVSRTLNLLAPDLSLHDLEVFPAQPDAGVPAMFRARITNTGPGSSGGVSLRVDLDGRFQEHLGTGRLAPGTSAVLTFAWPEALAGDHVVEATLPSFSTTFDLDHDDHYLSHAFRVVQPDPAVTGLAATPRRLTTDLTGPLVANPLADQDVAVTVANLGEGRTLVPFGAASYNLTLTACGRVEAPLPRGALPLPAPLPTVEPPSPPEEQCELVASWEAEDPLAPGEERVFRAAWDTRGRVGDFELCVALAYPAVQAKVDNDAACTRTFVGAGNTGLGGFFLLP